MTSMLVQSAREAASSSMGVGPCPGSSSPDAMSRRSWAVAPASSRPSFFQLTTTRSLAGPEARLAWFLVVSTIPAAFLGVAFESFIEERLGKPWIIAIMMIVFALVMYTVDHLARLDRDLEALTWTDAILIGIAQAFALCPGVSRSGITMMTGMALRLDRESAARYSFLLSIPVIGGAAAYKGLQVAQDGLPAGTAAPFAVGIAAAALSGFAAIWFLLAYLKRHSFDLFVIYRIAIGVGMLILIITGVRAATGI